MAISSEIPITPLIILFIYTPMFCSGHRKLLHQPFFPSDTLPPTASQPPRQQPKFPFSFAQNTPFFPLPLSPPPPPPATTAAVTFPANITSLTLADPSPKPISPKLIFFAITLSLLSAALIAAATFLLRRYICMYRRKTFRKKPESSHLLTPAPAANVSGEFLYLGTLRGIEESRNMKNGIFSGIATSSSRDYQRLSSPELRPLPPLPRHQPFSNESFDQEEEGDEEFFSPNLSPSNNNISRSNVVNNSSSPRVVFRNNASNLINNSLPSSVSSSPMDSSSSNSHFMVLKTSTRTLNSSSPDLIGADFRAKPIFGNVFSNETQVPLFETPGLLSKKDNLSMSSNSHFAALNLSPKTSNSNSPDLVETDFRAKPVFGNGSSNRTHNPFLEKDRFLAKRDNLSIPPPPPLPPQRFSEMLEPRKGQQVALKPLHWDKVRASSDRAMVWDQIKSSSFQLNEEMIEALFMVNGPGSSSSKNTRRLNQENRVIDQKKSQNIAILLRSLNVTVDEVCEALIEGTSDTLGTELLECLLKMAPSKEEECKLKESNDDSLAKLGPAEKFLKSVLDIPFAFKRVDSMLYVSNFDSEVEYLKKSFETLKAACEELKNSRMLRKLLDAVLQTGNRMNLGTERGGARAFNLDTLLKLVDIRGTDKKTTLLHFVVQEISQAEGSTNPGSTCCKGFDAESRRLGLRVVFRLSSELDNVKKAADLDLAVLGDDVVKLSNGIGKIKDVLRVECGERFSGSMKGFLYQAEREIATVQSLERECSGLVKAITEYFHGESGEEKARIFMVVRDFVSILDGVCKELEKVNDRSFVGSGCKFPLPVDQRLNQT